MAIVRQQIVDKIKAKLQTIATPTFYTSLGSKVEVWRSKSYFKPTMQAVNIRDTSDETSLDAEDESLETHALNVDVHLFFRSGTADELVRKGITDVKRALNQLNDDQTWNDLVDRIRPVGDEMTVEEEEDKLGGAVVRFIVEYKTIAMEEA